MSRVNIFVSHRIDIESELIANPIYRPVRCGAVFDHENPVDILGDDTGEHISERRMTFCEFTVQYWAWKNIDADYYGLCHYRRYLSFSEKQYKTDEFSMVHQPVITPNAMKKYGLLDHGVMENTVEQFDVLTTVPALVSRIPTPKGTQQTVDQLWRAHHGEFFEESSVDLMFELIDQMAPQYSRSAREYFASTYHRGYNCYVMKKELFDRLCQFQFPIMFAIEKQIDTNGYSQTMMRTPAFVGEMLYGIFMYHITTYEMWKTKDMQLVFFANANRIRNSADCFFRYIQYYADRMARFIVDPLFPKGSNRRERLKSIVFRCLPIKQRGVAKVEEGRKAT